MDSDSGGLVKNGKKELMDLRLPFKNKKAMPCIAAATDKARLDFGSHYHLRTASDVKSYARFEFSDPKYLHSHVHIAFMVWALLAASEATTASK